MAVYLPGLDTTRPADPENPPPAAGLEADVQRQTTTLKSRCIFLLVVIAILACILAPTIYYRDDKHYSVAIDAASVLDPKTGVSFNLTLIVASRSYGAKACVDPGMFVEVFYGGFQVAATNPAAAATRQICAKPRNLAELPIMARATMIPVGQIQDSLAAEMGQGATVFDLRLNIPSHGKSGLVLDCKGSRVGDAAAPCF